MTDQIFDKKSDQNQCHLPQKTRFLQFFYDTMKNYTTVVN
jgi:hypothetical protein